MLIRKSHLAKAFNEADLVTSLRVIGASISPVLWTKEKGEIQVFLSHCHSERDVLRNAMAILSSVDARLYIDWQDAKMHSATSGQSAMRIRSKISESDKFILVASVGAIASKWCNWELGIADARKFPSDIALLPVAEDNGTWNGAEYLQIYAHIETRYDSITGDYYVVADDTEIPLAQWIRS